MKEKRKLSAWGIAFLGAFASVIISLLFWFLCLNHVSVNRVGIAYNSIDGTIVVQMQPGWYVTSPFVRVANISTLPMRVQVPSDARIINQKIVRFRAVGAAEFVKLQGFEWLEERELENILLGYAFSGHNYAFLEILEESNNAGASR